MLSEVYMTQALRIFEVVVLGGVAKLKYVQDPPPGLFLEFATQGISISSDGSTNQRGLSRQRPWRSRLALSTRNNLRLSAQNHGDRPRDRSTYVWLVWGGVTARHRAIFLCANQDEGSWLLL
jgi:hypothetical protein